MRYGLVLGMLVVGKGLRRLMLLPNFFAYVVYLHLMLYTCVYLHHSALDMILGVYVSFIFLTSFFSRPHGVGDSELLLDKSGRNLHVCPSAARVIGVDGRRG